MTKLKNALLIVLLLALIGMIPLMVSGGKIVCAPDTDNGDDPFDDLFAMLIPGAYAEEENAFTSEPLPMDLFTPGKQPEAEGYVYDENGNVTRYEDASITVEMETRAEEKVTWRIAKVKIADASQLRTAVAGNKISSSKTAYVTALAKKYNAVVAIGGDDYQNNPDAKSFEYRMGQAARKKSNKLRDILVTDENGDLHIFICSDAAKMKQFLADGHTIVNAFTFGPALIMDGECVPIPKDYKYNPTGMEPRCAIGQTGPLSYVLVVAETETRNGTEGVTMEQLADFMFYQMGCLQAYNLDGGNSAEMVVNNKMYMFDKHNERDVNDIIYFASAVPENAD